MIGNLEIYNLCILVTYSFNVDWFSLMWSSKAGITHAEIIATVKKEIKRRKKLLLDT